MEETALMRHKLPERCPLGALAFYFFYRWHIEDEPWPDFGRRDSWYPIYVVKGASSVIESRYPKHYAAIKEVYEALGVQSTVKTQLGRKQAANAENKGASAASVDRQGHWATKSIVGAYANHSIPFDCVQVLAGFGPEPGRYYLHRTILLPPDHLQRLIFPRLEEAREKMRASGREIAGASFLDLLEYMKIVILQDAAVLMTSGFQHSLFSNHLFAISEFLQYKEQLITRMANTLQPESVHIQQVLPVVSEDLRELRMQTTHLRHDFTALQQTVEKTATSMEERTQRLHDQLFERLGQALLAAGASMQPNHDLLTPRNSAQVDTDANCSMPTLNISTPESSLIPPSVKMSRQPTSVQQVWCEYTVGLHPHPQLRLLESTFEARWRSTNSETQFFFRRKPVYDAIERLIEAGIDEQECIQLLQRLQGNKSIRNLADKLKPMLKITNQSSHRDQILKQIQ